MLPWSRAWLGGFQELLFPSQPRGSCVAQSVQAHWAVRSGQGLSAGPASTQGHIAQGNPPASPPAGCWAHSSRWGCAGCSGLGWRCCPGNPGCSPPWPHCPSGWSHRYPSSRPGSGWETPGDLCLSGNLQVKRCKIDHYYPFRHVRMVPWSESPQGNLGQINNINKCRLQSIFRIHTGSSNRCGQKPLRRVEKIVSAEGFFNLVV